MLSLSGLFNYLEANTDYYTTDFYNIHFHYLESHLNKVLIILQPFTKEKQIKERQDKIEELKQNPDLYSFIRDSLFCFREIEIYITKLLQTNDNKNEKDDKNFNFKNKLDAIKGIKDILCFIPHYVKFLKSYENYKSIIYLYFNWHIDINNIDEEELSQKNNNNRIEYTNTFNSNIKQNSINLKTNLINIITEDYNNNIISNNIVKF